MHNMTCNLSLQAIRLAAGSVPLWRDGAGDSSAVAQPADSEGAEDPPEEGAPAEEFALVSNYLSDPYQHYLIGPWRGEVSEFSSHVIRCRCLNGRACCSH